MGDVRMLFAEDRHKVKISISVLSMYPVVHDQHQHHINALFLRTGSEDSPGQFHSISRTVQRFNK